MKLFKYEGFRVTVEPEVLLLKPFKKIWDRDRSENKNKALSELAFIYFYCDPRSDFMFIIDEEDRLAEIKKQEGFKESWTPDKLVMEAMDLYRKLTVTVSSGLLEDARFGVLKIREALRTISFDNVDEEKVPRAIKDAVSALKEIPDLIKSIQEAEKAMNSEINENTRMRGQGQKTIFEEGLDN